MNDPRKIARSRGEWVVLALLSAAVLMPVWIVQYPALQDYWNHLLKARILAEYSNPVLGYSKYYSISYFPIPNMTSTLAIALLMKVFTPDIAGKIFLSICALLMSLSARYLVRCAKAPFKPLEYIGFALVYNQCFWYGFLDFCLSLAIAQYAIGYWIKNADNNRPAAGVKYVLLLMLTYFTHLWGALVLFGITAILAMKSSRAQRATWLISAVLLGGLFSIYVLGSGEHSGMEFKGLKFTLSILRNSLTLPRLVTVQPDKALLAASAALAGARVVLLGLLLWLAFRRRTPLFYIGLIMLAIYFFLPAQLGRMYEPGERMLVFLPALFAAAVAVRPRPRSAILLSTLITAAIALQVLATGYLWIKQDHRLNIYAAALSKIPAGKGVLNMVTLTPTELHGPMKLVDSDVHMPEMFFGAHYNIFNGGCYPNTFTTGIVKVRPGAVKLKPWLMADETFSWAEWIKRNKNAIKDIYEYIVVVGPTSQVNPLLLPDYKPRWKSANVELLERAESIRVR